MTRSWFGICQRARLFVIELLLLVLGLDLTSSLTSLS